MLLSPQTRGFLTCVCWWVLSSGDRPSVESRVRPESLRPLWHSALWTQKDYWAHLDAPFWCWDPLMFPGQDTGAVVGFTSFVPWISGVTVTCCLLSTVLKTDWIFSCFRKKVNLLSTNSSSWKQTKSASLEIKNNPWASVTHFYNFWTKRTLK